MTVEDRVRKAVEVASSLVSRNREDDGGVYVQKWLAVFYALLADSGLGCATGCVPWQSAFNVAKATLPAV